MAPHFFKAPNQQTLFSAVTCPPRTSFLIPVPSYMGVPLPGRAIRHSLRYRSVQTTPPIPHAGTRKEV